MSGSWWRGRPMEWDPDRQAIEEERQRWVYEKVGTLNQIVTDLTVDPRREYQLHRDEYIKTGDQRQLALALEYVEP